MQLYLWLRARIPAQIALLLAALWLAMLIFLAIFFADAPAATFRYGNI